jgi:hypothetical protein
MQQIGSLRPVVIAAALCASSVAAQIQERLQSDVQTLSRAAHVQCLREREVRLKKTATENREALSIVSSIFSEDYCGCAAEGIESELPPGSLGVLSSGALRERVLPIYQRCALSSFRRAIPTMCKTWYQGLFRKEEWVSEEMQTSMCGCLDNATASLRPEELQEVAAQTLQDYEEWRAKPASRFLAARPKSLLGQLSACARAEGLTK